AMVVLPFLEARSGERVPSGGSLPLSLQVYTKPAAGTRSLGHSRRLPYRPPGQARPPCGSAPRPRRRAGLRPPWLPCSGGPAAGRQGCRIPLAETADPEPFPALQLQRDSSPQPVLGSARPRVADPDVAR